MTAYMNSAIDPILAVLFLMIPSFPSFRSDRRI